MDTLEYTEYSLYSIVIIAYFLLAFYFMYVKFRHNKTQFYWVFISLMFLALGISRILFQVHYFYVPTLEGKMSNLSLVRTFLGFYVVATLFTWMGIISLMGWMGILVFRYDGKFFIKRREKKTQEGSKDELAQQVQVLQKQIEILESKQSGEKQEDSDLEATKSLTDFKKKKIVSLKKGGQEQGKDKLVVALRLIIIVVILALVLPILLGPVFRD